MRNPYDFFAQDDWRKDGNKNMTMIDPVIEESNLLSEVISEFLKRCSNEEGLPPFLISALAQHFSKKPSISAQEVKAILLSKEDAP